MVKKALIIFASLTAIIIVVCIILSIVNSKPIEFQSVVSFENGEVVMKSSSASASVSNVSNGDIPILSTLLNHEKAIMISSIFIILLFAVLFYGAKRSKS